MISEPPVHKRSAMRSRTSWAISTRSSASAGVEVERRGVGRNPACSSTQACSSYARPALGPSWHRHDRPLEPGPIVVRRRRDIKVRTQWRLGIAHADRRIENGRQPLAQIYSLVLLADQHGHGHRTPQRFLPVIRGGVRSRCCFVQASNGVRQFRLLGRRRCFRGFELRHGVGERRVGVLLQRRRGVSAAAAFSYAWAKWSAMALSKAVLSAALSPSAARTDSRCAALAAAAAASNVLAAASAFA